LNLYLFDICEYLDSIGVQYSHSGKNVTENDIGIECPFCPDGDPSNHLGIHLETKVFNCWRCGASGTAVKLIMSLEQIGFKSALRKIEYQTKHRKDLTRNIHAHVRERATGFDRIGLPSECEADLLDMHREFLEIRRFDPDYIFHKYNLQSVGKNSQKWKFRLIIPIYVNRRLVAWTSRDVTGQANIAYRHAPIEDCLIPVKETLYNVDTVKDTAIVVEGPLDAWRIGDGAVCTFGTQYTREQLRLLSNLHRVFVLFDFDARDLAKNFGADLGLFVNQTEILELEHGDPADMDQADVNELRRMVFGKIF
jgi:DNA primase